MILAVDSIPAIFAATTDLLSPGRRTCSRFSACAPCTSCWPASRSAFHAENMGCRSFWSLRYQDADRRLTISPIGAPRSASLAVFVALTLLINAGSMRQTRQGRNYSTKPLNGRVKTTFYPVSNARRVYFSPCHKNVVHSLKNESRLNKQHFTLPGWRTFRILDHSKTFIYIRT